MGQASRHGLPDPRDAASDSGRDGHYCVGFKGIESPEDSHRTTGDATVSPRKSLPGASVLSTESTAFFSRTYDEALDLVEAARSYLRVLEPIDRRSLRASERVRLCSETMRMTARLTQIMAWLLSQRAVQSGEISRAEALEDQQVLTEVQICMTQDEHAWRGLPQRLVSLLDKSHQLYIRVARLDELARRSVN